MVVFSKNWEIAFNSTVSFKVPILIVVVVTGTLPSVGVSDVGLFPKWQEMKSPEMSKKVNN
jgi:hypothetical protein